jgi:hypothetical protein
VTPRQCREARALLGWSERDLSRHAGPRLRSVLNYEIGRGRTQRATVDSLRDAFEAYGIEFVSENGEGPGVRLRKSSS